MYRILILFCILGFSYGKIDIEKYLKICNRNSLELNDCMADAVRSGIKTLSAGVEELNVPALDPFYQKEFKSEYKNNQIFVKILLTDIYVEGLNKATVHSARVRADDDQLHIEIDLSNPTVIVRANYEGNGQYNAIKVLADGMINTTMTNLVWTWKLDGVPYKNGTETYVRIKSFYMRPDVGKMETSMTNNNPETKELTELGARLINENWSILYREFLPIAQKNWEKLGVRYANKLFTKIPYDQILPK